MFKLDQCSKCGCQDLIYKTGVNKFGKWEGYKCQNDDCKHMEFAKTKRTDSQPFKPSAPEPSENISALIQDIHAMVKAIYNLEMKRQPKLTVKEDDQIPF